MLPVMPDVAERVEQRVVRAGQVEVGGRPGERPLVMIGSIFYAGHRIIQDETRGHFDKDAARKLLDREAELSATCALPRVIDVVGSTAEALIGYLEFVAAHTKSPLLVDSPVPEARMAAVRHFAGSEVAPRLIYNSLDENSGPGELECLAAAGVKNAVVLAFSNSAVRPVDKVGLLEKKLLPMARQAGVEGMLIDTSVVDLPSTAWSALAIQEVKGTLGLPAGCAPANAIYTWKRRVGWETPAFEACVASVYTNLIAHGADFVFYGPIGIARWAYPACAVADGLRTYAGRLAGVRPKAVENPLRKVL